MKQIFSRTDFPKAARGNGNEWKKAETLFHVTTEGLFVIKIVASAKNAKQNNSNDDDDLRVALDGFDFGKYERHQEMISWKGFGTSASWDGASLKGGTKTIFFFVQFESGEHTLQFFIDEAPVLKSIEVFEIENRVFELTNLQPAEKIKSDRKGIPWMSFVFIGAHAKSFILAVNAMSAKTKRSTDGDNLKIIVNGKIQQNPHAPKSYKYKNFYFSGDIKEFDIFSIDPQSFNEPLAFENAVELWYDESPEIANLSIGYFDTQSFLEELKKYFDLKKYVENRAKAALVYFRKTGKTYSAKFLEHSLKANPSPLIFESGHPFIKKIKIDPIYQKILEKLKEKILDGNINGEIWPEEITDGMNFNSADLKTALHGIHKIEYRATPNKKNGYHVEVKIFDIYDFQKQKVPFLLPDVKTYLVRVVNNALDIGEGIEVIHNFEIEIRLQETIQ